MERNRINIGQWVRFELNGYQAEGKRMVDGFVLTKRDPEKARIAVPSIRKTLSVPYTLIHDNEAVKFNIEDINDMIDIALMLREFDWVRELSEMKEMLV